METLGRPAISGRSQPHKMIYNNLSDHSKSAGGSRLSHFLDPENEYTELARRMEQIFLHSPLGSGWFRTRAEIEGMFPGLELVKPGLVRCIDWWPDGPQLTPVEPAQHCLVGAVGRKP